MSIELKDVIDSVLSTLNHVVEMDDSVMRTVALTRFKCRWPINGSNIIASPALDGGVSIGFVGLLNGLIGDLASSCGVDPAKVLIYSQFDNDGDLLGFATNFEYQPECDRPDCLPAFNTVSQGLESMAAAYRDAEKPPLPEGHSWATPLQIEEYKRQLASDDWPVVGSERLAVIVREIKDAVASGVDRIVDFGAFCISLSGGSAKNLSTRFSLDLDANKTHVLATILAACAGISAKQTAA